MQRLLWAEAFESQSSPHAGEEDGGFLPPFPHCAETPRAPQGGGSGTQGCGHTKPGRGTKTLHIPAQKCSHCSPSQLMPLGRAVLVVTQGICGSAGVLSRVPSTPKCSPAQCVIFGAVMVWVGVCSPELPLAASLAAPCTRGSRQALPPWLAAPRMICGGAGSNVAWREHCFPAAHADLCK